MVIDTLARCIPGQDENSSQVMTQVIYAADTIRAATGATVFFVHHTGKDGKDLRGHSSLLGGLDTTILVEKKGNIVTLKCGRQKDGPRFDPVKLRLVPVGPSCVLESVDATETSHQIHETNGVDPETLRSAHETFHETFGNGPGKGSDVVKAIQNRCGISKAHGYRVIKALVNGEHLDKTGPDGRPVYVLGPKVPPS